MSLASLPWLSMLTLLKHAYLTRLKSSKHVKMSAISLEPLLEVVNAYAHMHSIASKVLLTTTSKITILSHN
jgi:hypothetical protein